MPVEAVDLGLTVDDASSDPVTYHFETDVAWLTGGPSSDPTYVYPGDVFLRMVACWVPGFRACSSLCERSVGDEVS